MPDLIYEIKTTAELSGAISAEKSLESQIGKAKVLGKDYSDLQKQLDGVRSKIAEFQAKNSGGLGDYLREVNSGLVDMIPGLGRVESGLAKIASGPTGMVAAGMAAVGGAFALAAKSFREFSSAETSVAKLDTALAQIGQLTDSTRQKIQSMAEAQESLTGISGESWTQIMTSLLQFSKSAESLDRDTEAVKNFAGITGSLQEAAMGVGKALQGHFDIFNRYGIYISETGSQVEKLNQLYQELAVRGGGQLEAQMKTMTGQITGLKNSWGNLLKSIGQHISESEILKASIGVASESMQWFAEKIGHTVNRVDGLTNTLRRFTPSADDTAKAIKRFGLEMEEAGRQAKALETAYANVQERVKMQLGNEDANAEAAKERRLALIDVAAKQEVISYAQAAAMKLIIEDNFAKEKLARHKAAVALQTKIEEDAYAAMVKRESEVRGELDSIRSEKARATDNDKQYAKANRWYQAYQNEKQDFDKLIEARNRGDSSGFGWVGRDQLDNKISESQRLMDRYEQNYKAAEAQVKPVTKTRQQLDEEEKAVLAELAPIVTRNRERKLDLDESRFRRQAELDQETTQAKSDRTLRNINDYRDRIGKQPEATLSPEFLTTSAGASNQFMALANRLQQGIGRNNQLLDGVLVRLMEQQDSQYNAMQRFMSRHNTMWNRQRLAPRN